MDLIRNIPFFSIMLCMFGAIIMSVLGHKASKVMVRTVFSVLLVMSSVLLYNLHLTGDSFVFKMGHFPAPWGNEIRAGELEALMAVFVCVVALAAVTAGYAAIKFDVEEEKINLFFILSELMVASLLALIYTNDLFTAYVFIEINTIAGCGLIMVRQTGKAIVTAIRYMVVSLLGSGLFLIGVTLLYTITGHLLMSNIREAVDVINAKGEYSVPLTIIVGLMTVGLCIKSGLFPFHLWIPNTYGYSNVSSSAMLSGIASKGYIFLLIKIIYRVIGLDNIVASGILDILFILGIIATIMGSVFAIFERNFRKVIAFSSVAQIGYIFIGIGLGTHAGMVAACFHIIAHGITKALLFVSSAEITEGSHNKQIDDIYGMGHKYRFSSLCFSIGAFSIVGFPFLAGFVSKLLFSEAAYSQGWKMPVIISTLAISTLLNTVYFLRIVIRLYSSRVLNKNGEVVELAHDEDKRVIRVLPESRMLKSVPDKVFYCIAIGLFTLLNILVGCNSQFIIDVINNGLKVFG